MQFRREKREGLPDGVAVLKVEQLGGGGRAEGTGGDVNEEADVLVGGVEAGGTWTHLKCFHAEYSTVNHDVTVEIRWVHSDRNTHTICMRGRDAST